MTRDITEIKEQGFTLLDNTQRKGKKWHGIYSLNSMNHIFYNYENDVRFVE